MGQPNTSNAGSSLDMLARLWERRRVFGVVFAATICLAVAALLVLPVRYLATASVIVAEQELGAGHSSPAWDQKIGDPADLESQLLVIRSPRLLRLVMNAPGVVDAVVRECSKGGLLGSSERCDRLKSDAGAFIDRVESRFSIASAGRSRVINISYQSSLPDVAQTLANALTEVFLDDQRDEGANSREVASSWLRKELKQLDEQLQAADDKIQKFRRSKGLMRGATAPISSERLTSISQQLAQAEAAKTEAAARLQEIKSEQARGPTDAPSVLASRSIADLKQQLTTVSAQLASAATMLGPKHPSMLALSREQALVQQRLTDEMQNIAASVQKTYDANDDAVRSLKMQLDAAKAEAGSATLDEASIESMVRDTEIKRQQYAELYKKASELETERRVLRGSTRLVSLAELPSKPFFPKKLPFLAAGITLAIIFGIGAALMADRLAPFARSGTPVAPAPKTADVETLDAKASAVESAERQAAAEVAAPAVQSAPVAQAVESARLPANPEPQPKLLPTIGDAPIVACLPRLKTLGQLSAVGAILQSHRALSIAQLLRLASEDAGFQGALHALVHELGIGSDGQTRRIAVTSAERGEGKTATLLALAEHLAAAGRRVLVVECDERSPAFEQVLGLRLGAGLRGVAAGAITLEDAVQRTDHPNFDVLPLGFAVLPLGFGGAPVPDLLAHSLAARLSGLSGYDAILIDTPLSGRPGEHLAGVDRVLLCVRGDRTGIEPAMAAIVQARALGAADVAIVVTMTEPERSCTGDAAPFATPNVYARAG